jgi:hypothetical protein
VGERKEVLTRSYCSTFGSDLTAFMGKPALPNCVYAIHDYTSYVPSHLVRPY